MEALEKHCLGRESDIQMCAFLQRASPEEKKRKEGKIKDLAEAKEKCISTTPSNSAVQK